MRFKEYIKCNNISTDATLLNCSYSNLTDLKGIESFNRLEELDCFHNQLTDIKGIEN